VVSLSLPPFPHPRRLPERFSSWSGNPAVFEEEAAQGRQSRKSAVSLSEGVVHGPPRVSGGLGDVAGGLTRPFPGPTVVAVGPFKDLAECPFWSSFPSHRVNPFPTEAAPLWYRDGLLPLTAVGKSGGERRTVERTTGYGLPEGLEGSGQKSDRLSTNEPPPSEYPPTFEEEAAQRRTPR
jgi:hypothetical protein